MKRINWKLVDKPPLMRYVLEKMEKHGITAKDIAEYSWDYNLEMDNTREDAKQMPTCKSERTIQGYIRELRANEDLPDEKARWVVWGLNRCLIKRGEYDNILDLEDLRGVGYKQRKEHIDAGADYLAAIFKALDRRRQNTLLDVAQGLLATRYEGRPIPEGVTLRKKLAYTGELTDEENDRLITEDIWESECANWDLHDKYFPEEQPCWP